MKKKKTNKLGRNDPCYCGSGKKFKKCHGKTPNYSPSMPPMDNEWENTISKLKAQEIQRQEQQGLGKEIISCEFKSYRIVAVGNRIYYSNKWKTFHDFLFSYIQLVFGESWWNKEQKKDPNNLHPILKWHQIILKKRETSNQNKEEIIHSKMVGAEEVFFRLSYNLYLLAHNIQIQELLIKRLKITEHFHPAFYETIVAGNFILCGYQIDLEKEDDPKESHCEFSATNKKTGRKFSVEAKFRKPHKEHVKVSNQMRKALAKKALHERVIFIEMNLPITTIGKEVPMWMRDAVRELREAEDWLNQTSKEGEAPSAYVILTNNSALYFLDEEKGSRSAIGEGFKIPDFGYDFSCDLETAIESEQKHEEILELLDSIKGHTGIPATFDGQAPEFAFSNSQNRLLIGKTHSIPNGPGEMAPGVLKDAIVIENERAAYCIYEMEDGRQNIIQSPLSSEELSAYKSHPDTFFGVYKKVPRGIRNIKEMYDFLFETYKNSTREKLLDFLKDHPNIENYKNKTQEDLAKIYCMALANSTAKRFQK